MAGVVSTPSSLLLPKPLHVKPKPRSRLRVSCSAQDESSSASSPAQVEEKRQILPPVGFKAPEAKTFLVRPDKQWEIFTATLPLFFRFGSGLSVLGYESTLVKPEEIPSNQYALKVGDSKLRETSKLGPRPNKPIEIYEFESCPFCRKVREMVSILDLDVMFYPCPQNGPNFRPKVLNLGGKMQFPYMVDPNTGVAMYESDDIIKYLADNYGDGSVPLPLSLGFITTITALFALLPRLAKGMKYTPSQLPPVPLEIWAFEASPFCKVVREVLVELEIPHLLHSIARGSPRRQEFFQKYGLFQVPYLEDPNTGVKMFESPEIIEYLRATYSL